MSVSSLTMTVLSVLLTTAGGRGSPSHLNTITHHITTYTSMLIMSKTITTRCNVTGNYVTLSEEIELNTKTIFTQCHLDKD